jgi:hypothetical protein
VKKNARATAETARQRARLPGIATASAQAGIASSARHSQNQAA